MTKLYRCLNCKQEGQYADGYVHTEYGAICNLCAVGLRLCQAYMTKEEPKVKSRLERMTELGLIGCLNNTDVTSENYKENLVYRPPELKCTCQPDHKEKCRYCKALEITKNTRTINLRDSMEQPEFGPTYSQMCCKAQKFWDMMRTISNELQKDANADLGEQEMLGHLQEQFENIFEDVIE